jgi:hypothetical protein
MCNHCGFFVMHERYKYQKTRDTGRFSARFRFAIHRETQLILTGHLIGCILWECGPNKTREAGSWARSAPCLA